MTKIIYVVTAGAYSDYHICAIFTDEEIANKYVKKYNDSLGEFDDHASVEKHELDNPPKKWVSLYVRMNKDGKVVEKWRRLDNDKGFQCFDINDNLVYAVRTEDEQIAIKVTNEHRLMLIAENKWGRKK